MTAARGERPRRPGSRERLAWLALLAAAAATRLWDLGSRVMSHDESLHAYYSWVLAMHGEYVHHPSLHGPLLYHLDALVFLLLGASDATARLLPALAGVLCLAMLYPLRRYLGSGGALAAAALALTSPVLLFYSRYLRNDIYIALLSLVWVWALFRYLETRSPRWLYLLSGAMALSIASKEVAFIQGLIFGGYALARAAARRRDGPRDLAAGDAALMMMTLVLPFAAGGWHMAAGWALGADGPRALPQAGLSLGVLVAAAAVLALVWFGPSRRGSRERGGPGLAVWGRCAALVWGLDLLLFTTLGTNPRSGLVSGFVGSLGYWLGQHEVARGSQPWFYYLLLAAVYELLTVLLAALGVLWLLRSRGAAPAPSVPAADGDGGAFDDAARRREFLAFCAWWAIAAGVAYSAAGERMPWLLVHPMQPLYLLGGWGLARLLAATTGALRWQRPAQVAAATGVLLPVALVALTGGGAAAGAPAAATVLRGLVQAAAVASLLAALTWAGWRIGRRSALRAAVVGVVALGALWTCRTAWQASFVNEDLATELLVYAHSSPDVKTVLRELELISLRTVGERQLEVAYHPDVAWPFSWYLRDFPNARALPDAAALEGADPAVLLAGAPPPTDLWRHVTGRFVSRTYRLTWWPAQGYIGRPLRDLWRSFGEAPTRDRLRQILLFRRYPGAPPGSWPNRKDFRMYVRPDLDPLGGELPFALAGVPPRPRLRLTVAEWDWQPVMELSGPFAHRSLDGPTAVAATGDGGWVVADAGNRRVLLLDAAGRLQRQIALADEAEASPAGSGGSGEAWGVAVWRDGSIAVADTWRGRIRRFDAEGREAAAWGRFGSASEDRPGDPALYGPRGLVFDPAGRLIVADTGNHRLLRFGGDGNLLRAAGGSLGLARFAEPVGLAFDAEGRLLVADTWNQRIQRLGSGLQPLEHWEVPGWESRAPLDKPFLTVDAEGRIYATDPAAGRVLLFSPQGELLAGLRVPALHGTRQPRPTGVAWDRVSGRIAVCDQEGDRVLLLLPPEQADEPD